MAGLVFKFMVGSVRNLYILSSQRYISMESTTDCMKLKEIDENIGEREMFMEPQYRKIDRYGRLQVGLNYANKEVLVIYVEPKPEDKMRFLKVGRR
jgi:DNA-directed RNA polymerase beta subunit